MLRPDRSCGHRSRRPAGIAGGSAFPERETAGFDSILPLTLRDASSKTFRTHPERIAGAMNRFRSTLLFAVILLWSIPAAADAAGPAMDRLRATTADLQRNARYLAEIRTGLNEAATAGLFVLDDEQLNAVQRSAIFVDMARLICGYQGALFAVTPYIREDARSDFFTLRHRDLEDAIFESREIVKALRLYGAAIRETEVRELAQEGAAAVSANIRLFERMRERAAPLTNSR